MNPSLCTSLTLPADMRFLPMVQGYIREMAQVALLPHEESLGLELAVDEAFTNIIEHAYPDCRPGNVFLDVEIRDTEIILSIRDEGLPFYPSLEDDAISKGIEGKTYPHGYGLKIIRHEVDEAHFENLGQRGKVLRLVKRLSRPIEMESGEVVRDTEMAPPQSYETRPLRPEETVQVPRLFWQAYGYSYSSKFYRPEDLVRLVESGRVISYVTVAEDGTVVGHVGLLRHGPVPMAKKAFLAVAPAHRGRGIMEALSSAIEAEALKLGLLGICVDPVTSHIISQREAISQGFKPCGLDLADVLPLKVKGLVREDLQPQRESLVHCFKYISPPPAAVVYVPPQHQAMVGRIYEVLGYPCRFGEPEPTSLPGDYQISLDKTMQKGQIGVISANQHHWPVILRAADDLEKFGGAEVVNLDLPLAQPASALVFELAEKSGFFFSSVRPCEAQDGDRIRLQRLNVPLDPGRLCIYPGWEKEIFEYVTGQMASACRK